MSESPHEVPEQSVLLVIPAFRESRRLPGFLPHLLSVLRESGLPVRVRVVDDGSPAPDRDAVAALCRDLSVEFPALLPMLALPRNLGKGGAVHAGWDSEKVCAWLGFCDADGSVGPDEIVRLIRMLLDRDFPYDALIASRVAGGDRPVRRSPARAALSRLFSAWVRRMTGLPVRDTQCGCKFVRAERFAVVRPGLGHRRFAFDVELLVRLAEAGASLREEPVAWTARAGGSLRPLRDGLSMALAVLKIGRVRKSDTTWRS